MTQNEMFEDEENGSNSSSNPTPKNAKRTTTVNTNDDNNWTDKNEQLLMKWAEKAAGYRWLHNMARINFKKTHDYLSYPTIVLSSITGVGGFAVLNPSGSENTSETSKQNILNDTISFCIHECHRWNHNIYF